MILQVRIFYSIGLLTCFMVIIHALPLPPAQPAKSGGLKIFKSIKEGWNKTVDKTISKLESHSERHYNKNQHADAILTLNDDIKKSQAKYDAVQRKHVLDKQQTKANNYVNDKYTGKLLYHKGHLSIADKAASAIRTLTGRPKGR